MSTNDVFGFADAGEQQHRNEAGQRRLREAYEGVHRWPGPRYGPPVVVSIVEAVDSQLRQMEPWPVDRQVEARGELRARLVEQVKRLDALEAAVDDTADS